ncbi:MAG TPA: DMT family transporter [Pyrinomonadaceae bacterium]
MATNWKLGLALSLVTVVFWGVLPLALSIALTGADPYTVTWFRFTVATIVLGAVMSVTRNLPSLHSMTRFSWMLLVIAVLGLAGNYVLFLLALSLTSPTVAQTLAQLSSIFLLLGGVLVFKERLSLLQRIGLVVLLIGLGLLFNKRFLELSLSRRLAWGIALALLSAVVWSAYGLAQKRLLQELGSQQILLLIFFGSSVLLLPFASPDTIPNMNALQFGALLFCCVNSLIAYGSFAEALKHWKVSRVGAVIATAPLFTLASMFVAKRFVAVPSEELNAASVVGILFVVVGSALCALEGRQTPQHRGVAQKTET